MRCMYAGIRGKNLECLTLRERAWKWEHVQLENKRHQQEKLINTENTMVVNRGNGGEEVVKVKEGRIFGNRRRFHFGWWAHNAIHR